MFLKYLLLEEGDHKGKAPLIATEESACADLALPHDVYIPAHERITIPLLIAFDIPVDWCLYLQPRSSTFTKIGLLSTTGVVDSDYKDSVHAQLYNMSDYPVHLVEGQRVVQVQLFQKQRIQFEEVNAFTNIKGPLHIGFGSTGE
jgi:deoxyuridine 5'-triphosphate nucleotidohydrolase